MFYILLLAVLQSLMLQIYQTKIMFIYNVRLVRHGWDKDEIEGS